MTIPLCAALPRRFSCQPGHSWAETSLAEVSGNLAADARTFPREAPIRHCSGWGLPCRPGCPVRGGLLPHRFTLTLHAGRFVFCGAFPGVTPAGRYPAPFLHGVRTFLETKVPRSSSPPREVGNKAKAVRHQVLAENQAVAARFARSAASRRSVASSGPAAHGRTRNRKAASRAVSGASG